MKTLENRIGIFLSLLLAVILLLNVCSVGAWADNILPDNGHLPLTQKLIDLLETSPELKGLMEESLEMARKINPNPDTNPAQDLASLYTFLDRAYTCMPWNVLDEEYPDLYDTIDQCVDYFWFLVDQPLPELGGEGYYYPSLQYHEPIASWIKEYAETWGDYLDTEDSWNDEYYELFLNAEKFHLKDGWYADSNVWKTWNEFFARGLISPDKRPIADCDLVAPADSKPQGVWQLDSEGNLKDSRGVSIKSGVFSSVVDLIGRDSAYCNSFGDGILTHTFLDVNDYHRYHFPISGTVLEVRKISGTNAAGGVTIWDAENNRYRLLDQKAGWQMIETRDCVILDTEFGLVAILPIGMSQICSCNFEESVQPGAQVSKGDPMGYFLFGGSDIVMVFQSGVEFESLVPADESGGLKHILAGEPYAALHVQQEELSLDE